jgi:hypothetical protein
VLSMLYVVVERRLSSLFGDQWFPYKRCTSPLLQKASNFYFTRRLFCSYCIFLTFLYLFDLSVDNFPKDSSVKIVAVT